MNGDLMVSEGLVLPDFALSAEASETDLGAADARELTRQIRVGLEHSYTLIIAAWRGRAWRSMGYHSWDAYCQEEFGNLPMQPPREERQAVVLSLREAGMSVRAIASASGLGRGTVARELSRETVRPALEREEVSGVPFGTPEMHGRVLGTDGKSYMASVSTATAVHEAPQAMFEDVPLSDELLALSPDEVGIGLLTPSPARPVRDRKDVVQRMTGAADAPLPMVIRLAGEIALDPAALAFGGDPEVLSGLVTDASRGVLALSHVLASVDTTAIAGQASDLAVVSAAVTDAVSELSRFLDDVHAGRS